MTSNSASGKSANRDRPQDIVQWLIANDDAQHLTYDRLQNLLFLVDREHVRSFRTVLTSLQWVHDESGPRSDDLNPTLAKIDERYPLPQGLRPHREHAGRIAEHRSQYGEDPSELVSPRAFRSLQRVFLQHGSSTNDHIRREIEATPSYQRAAVGATIDFSMEPSWLELAAASGGPDLSERGSPEVSAAEDREIMEFMDRWRESDRQLHPGR